MTGLQFEVDIQVHIAICSQCNNENKRLEGHYVQEYKYAYANILQTTIITFEIELQRARLIRHLILPSIKFVPHAFSHQICFSPYQSILLCKAHHRKFLLSAQLQHYASHHG